MKTVYFLRAMAGHGASTFIRKNGLARNTISFDEAKEMVISNADSDLSYMQHYNSSYFRKSNNLVFKMFNLALDHKIEFEENIIVDALNFSFSRFESIYKKVIEYGYVVKVVDFGLNDFEFYRLRNAKREASKQIENSALIKIYDSFKNVKNINSILDKCGDFITPSEMVSELSVKSIDLAEMNEIKSNTYCFGDIHGCYDALMKFESEIGFNDTDKYIFLGDYIDRGDKSADVFKFIIKNIDRDNFIFIAGNHEKYIYDSLMLGWENCFSKITKDEMNKSGIDDDQILKTYYKMKPYYISKISSKNIVFSHGGLAKVPNMPELLPRSSYVCGDGQFELDIDRLFSDNHPSDNWYQIHGHRNVYEYSCFLNKSKSYSLECKVEFGGSIAVLNIDKDSNFKGLYFTNDNV